MFSRPIKLGIIGLGKIAIDQHLPAVAQSRDFKLVAGCSLAAPEVPFPVYATLEEMLKRHPDITAVSVCTPPLARFPLAMQAIGAGRHVFLEKPPAATLGEAEVLRDAAAAARVTLFASWHSRYAAAVERARQWLAARTIRTVTIHWKENIRQWHPGQAWIMQAGGMGVFDPGINALSILTHLMPKRVVVRKADLHVPQNCEAPIQAELDMLSGDIAIRAEFDFLQADVQTWEMIIATDGGELKLSWGGAQLDIDGRQVFKGTDVEYAGLYGQFAKLMRAKRSDADFEPLRIVADATLIGRPFVAPAYIE